MNPCILITSHLNSQHKTDIALKFIEFLKTKSLPIVVAGNFPIPIEVQKEVNHSLFINENPMVNRISYAWKHLPSNAFGEGLRGITSNVDYGYAHLHQTLSGFKLCQSLGYDYVYHLNYDASLTDEEYDKMLNTTKDYVPMIFPWGEGAISTACYGFKTTDYIEALKPRMHYYANCNPPLPPNWFCETFFKWVLEDSGIIEGVGMSEVQIKLVESGTETKTPLGTFSFYHNIPTDSYLVFGASSTPVLRFKVAGKIIVAEPIGDMCFQLPSIEGDYYLETEQDSIYMFSNNPQYRGSHYVATS